MSVNKHILSFGVGLVMLLASPTYAAAGNADIKDLDSYADNKMTTWKGRGLIVLRSTHKKGMAKLTIKAEGMKPVVVSIPCK